MENQRCDSRINELAFQRAIHPVAETGMTQPNWVDMTKLIQNHPKKGDTVRPLHAHLLELITLG